MSDITREYALIVGICDNFCCSQLGFMRPLFDIEGNVAAYVCAIDCKDRMSDNTREGTNMIPTDWEKEDNSEQEIDESLSDDRIIAIENRHSRMKRRIELFMLELSDEIPAAVLTSIVKNVRRGELEGDELSNDPTGVFCHDLADMFLSDEWV